MALPVDAAFEPIKFEVNVPNGSQSPAQHVSVPSRVDGKVTVGTTTGFLLGAKITIGATSHKVTLRAYDGNPDGGGTGVLIYEVELTPAANGTASDFLGDQAIPFFSGLYVTEEGDGAGVVAQTFIYVSDGATIKKL